MSVRELLNLLKKLFIIEKPNTSILDIESIESVSIDDSTVTVNKNEGSSYNIDILNFVNTFSNNFFDVSWVSTPAPDARLERIQDEFIIPAAPRNIIGIQGITGVQGGETGGYSGETGGYSGESRIPIILRGAAGISRVVFIEDVTENLSTRSPTIIGAGNHLNIDSEEYFAIQNVLKPQNIVQSIRPKNRYEILKEKINKIKDDTA